MSGLLVVAAHPDDEVLGAGSTMARAADHGERVNALIVAEGATSRDGDHSAYCEKLASKHRLLMIAMCGIESYEYLCMPDQKLDTVGMLFIAKAISAIVDKLNPHTVITHFDGDCNLDHRIVADATMVACRPQPGSQVRRVLAMEVPSATGWGWRQFSPNYFVSAEAHWKHKLDALRIYDEEMRPHPHARSYEALDALSKHRGASVGLCRAEAFELVRSVARDW